MMKEELEADIRADRYQEWLADQPKCRQCGELWTEDGIYDDNRDEYYCDQTCIAEYEQEKAEAAQEARFHAYWEG